MGWTSSLFVIVLLSQISRTFPEAALKSSTFFVPAGNDTFDATYVQLSVRG